MIRETYNDFSGKNIDKYISNILKLSGKIQRFDKNEFTLSSAWKDDAFRQKTRKAIAERNVALWKDADLERNSPKEYNNLGKSGFQKNILDAAKT